MQVNRYLQLYTKSKQPAMICLATNQALAKDDFCFKSPPMSDMWKYKRVDFSTINDKMNEMWNELPQEGKVRFEEEAQKDEEVSEPPPPKFETTLTRLLFQRQSYDAKIAHYESWLAAKKKEKLANRYSHLFDFVDNGDGGSAATNLAPPSPEKKKGNYFDVPDFDADFADAEVNNRGRATRTRRKGKDKVYYGHANTVNMIDTISTVLMKDDCLRNGATALDMLRFMPSDIDKGNDNSLLPVDREEVSEPRAKRASLVTE